MQESLNGSNVLREVTAHLGIDLCSLVAGCAFWAPNEGHYSKPQHPTVRRARKGEKRGETVGGIRFDDNSYANIALKKALRHMGLFKGFEVCHIWPASCYDERYHTALANLVLLPRALASLTDHDRVIQQCLQYRSWELYGWHPANEAQPQKPDKYPINWRDPIPPYQKHETLFRGPKHMLPITLVPADDGEFRNAFMRQGKATINITYSDGRSETKVWRIRRFNEHSSILGNLRSRPEFRSGEWQENHITRVEVRVSGY